MNTRDPVIDRAIEETRETIAAINRAFARKVPPQLRVIEGGQGPGGRAGAEVTNGQPPEI